MNEAWKIGFVIGGCDLESHTFDAQEMSASSLGNGLCPDARQTCVTRSGDRS